LTIKAPLFKHHNSIITSILIFVLIGIGAGFLINHLIYSSKAGDLDKTFKILGYASAPLGLVSWYIRENRQRLKELEKNQEDFQLLVNEELAKLRIKIEFSFRFGQQQADLQQIKQFLGMGEFKPPDSNDVNH
jgi:hypothetical protein